MPEGVSYNFEKVSPSNPDYLKEKMMQESIVGDSGGDAFVFGGQELRILSDDADVWTKVLPADRLRAMKNAAKKRLYDIWQDVVSSFASGGRDSRACIIFLSEILGDKDILDKLKKREGVGSVVRSSSKSWFAVFSPEIAVAQAVFGYLNSAGHSVEDIPISILAKMTERHIKLFNERQEIFDQILSETQTEVFGLLKKGISDGILPVSEGRLQEVIGGTTVIAIDGINAKLLEIYGEYSRQMDRISLDVGLVDNPKEFKRVLMHEYLHALSGRTVIKIEQVALEDEEVVNDYYGPEFSHRRTGARIGGEPLRNEAVLSPKPWNRFSWFNEAITERTSLELLSEDKGSYATNRELLQHVFDQLGAGAEEIFKNAYFEDFDHEKGGVPKWKEMMVAVNQKFGVGFLVRLDKFINFYNRNKATNSTGTKMALDKWKELGDSFPEFLTQWYHDKRAETDKMGWY